MKDNIGISFGIQGMERQNFHHLQDEKVFTFQRNGNLETDENSIGLTNEHSNILCSKFRPDFKVVGHKVDALYNRVYFFITNPFLKISEIGYINFNIEGGCDCEDTPLEEVEQVSFCEYTKLLSDECNKCLNFDVNYPIKDIEIKHEVLGTMLIFTDGFNPPRFLNVSDIESYKKKYTYATYESVDYVFYKPSVNKNVVTCNQGNLIRCADTDLNPSQSDILNYNNTCYTCKETVKELETCECSEELECIEDVCVDCDKLKIFPDFMTPTLDAEKIQQGGRLPMGTYEFAIAYTDSLGNEMTSYYSFTNKVKIFEESLAVIGNDNLEKLTNLGIRLRASNLDKRFTNYKIAIIHTDSQSSNMSVYSDVLHQITDEEVTISSVKTLPTMTLNEMYAIKPTFKTWNGLTVANNYLFGYGYTKEEEWNLQPIGVLMGALMEWQTDVASENLYKDGIATERFGGYMRDEVYPLSFRIHTDYGYTSPLVNLVGRPSTSFDKERVTTKLEVQSIYEGVSDCADVSRTERWQFYNTASEKGMCGDYNLENGEVVRKILQESCVIQLGETFANGTIVITETDDYFDLFRYIEDNKEDICDPRSIDYYNPFLCSILNYSSDEICVPNFNYPICDTDCNVNYCEIPEIVPFDDGKNYKNEIVEIHNERIDYDHKELVNYEREKKMDFCMIAESDDYRSSIDVSAFEFMTEIDDDWKEKVRDKLADDDRVYDKEVYKDDLERDSLKLIRKNHVEYNDCSTAIGLEGPVDFYFTNIIEKKKESLVSRKPAVAMGKFGDRIGKNALWYRVDFSEDDDFKIVEIARGMKDQGFKDSTVGDNIVRISTFASCSNAAAPISTFLVNIIDGSIFRVNKTDYPRGVCYIAMDTEIKEIKTDKKYWHRYKKYKYEPDYPKNEVHYTNASTNYCSYIHVRDKEYNKITINYDTLTVERTVNYEAFCTYIVPKTDDCISQPYKHGIFSYWESTVDYPNNNDLYNAKKLKISPKDLGEYAFDFEKYFATRLGSDGNYILNDNADVTCKPIRHFKFPDNSVAPFMEYENQLDAFSTSRIYPIGFKYDDALINRFLDIAAKNGLITQKQRNSITDVEFFRGDRRIHKSVLYKGIANDMYKDTTKQNTFFRNFPYNTLGKNDFLSTSSDRNTLLEHPFNSRSNNRFSLIAPEIYYNTQTELPSEISVEGYMYGSSIGSFKEVEDHSKWVILGNKLIKLAKRFALLESASDVAMGASVLADAFNGFRIGLSNNPMTPASIALGVASNIVNISAKVATSSKYTVTWLNSFKDMGSPHNFAAMFISPKGWYNTFAPNKTDNHKIRGIRNRVLLKPGINQLNEGSYITRINNVDRESSLYLYLGEGNNINYPTKYINYDNATINYGRASRHISSRVADSYGVELTKNIASPYISVKNFIPDQYGNVDSIKWLSTGNKIRLKTTTTCKTMFGGDITISRVSLKNKFPFFNVNAMKLANRTPIKYSIYGNVAHPTFYCDYDVAEESLGLADMPVLNSVYKFDSFRTANTRYISDPSKFYLFSYGVPMFLVESEINSNFRYRGLESHEQFAESVDVYNWVQEKNTPISYNNIFYYNNIFSTPQTSSPYRILDANYDKDAYKKLSNIPNGVVYSQPDNSEISLDNPWRVFKPYDETLFKTEYGRLIKLKGIESEQVLGVFENNSVVFNAVDTLRDRITADSVELGTGGIFATRPMEFNQSELGDNGSQHSVVVSTEFGHFIVDAKRGKVFKIHPNAKGISVISDMKESGGESGMRKWFKRHLPFKILKHGIKNLTELDTDNTYKGLGILAWWDSVYKRLFIAKKDYIPLVDGIEFNKDRGFVLDGIEISVKDDRYFKDVSWTVAYSALYQCWVSYYDFKPDYAIGLPNYFQTGINYGERSEIGVWSHLLTNKSFQVFYGKKHPWEIEIPIKNTYTNNYLKDIKVWTETKKYLNNFDFTNVKDKSFNKLIVYNNTNNSGELTLSYENTLSKKGYPKAVEGSTTSQVVCATHDENQLSVNYFFNRVIDNNNHINIWDWDSNEIFKTLNPKAVGMKSKRVLERLRGDWFVVRLIQDDDSRYKQMFKWMQYTEKSY